MRELILFHVALQVEGLHEAALTGRETLAERLGVFVLQEEDHLVQALGIGETGLAHQLSRHGELQHSPHALCL